MKDGLGNTPPAIAPIPYFGFSATDIDKGQVSLGTTNFLNPVGVLKAVEFTGDLNPGTTLYFSCNPWTPLLAGTLVATPLFFKNSVEPRFSTSVQVKCNYRESAPPAFMYPLEPIALVANNPTQWVLPTVLEGSFSLSSVRFEPQAALSTLVAFDEASRTVAFKGTKSMEELCNKELAVVITLVN